MTIKNKLNKNIGLHNLNTEHQVLTKAICNRGFRGNPSILPLSIFGVSRQRSCSQSLTAATLNRWQVLMLFAVKGIFKIHNTLTKL